jgi:hypothetical protein
MTIETIEIVQGELTETEHAYLSMVRTDLNLDRVFPWASDRAVSETAGIIAETVRDNCRVLNIPYPSYYIRQDTRIKGGSFYEVGERLLMDRGELAADLYAHKYLKSYKTTGMYEEIQRFLALIESGINIRELKILRKDRRKRLSYLQSMAKEFGDGSEPCIVGGAVMHVMQKDGGYAFKLGYGLSYLREVVDMQGSRKVEAGIELRRVTAHELYHAREAIKFPELFLRTASQ